MLIVFPVANFITAYYPVIYTHAGGYTIIIMDVVC